MSADGSSGALPAAPSSGEEDSQLHLRFLLVNGSEFRMSFAKDALVRGVKEEILNQKPRELSDMLVKQELPQPTRIEELRILHMGKFLDDAKSLPEHNLQTGTANQTAVHLSIKSPSTKLDDVKDKFNRKAACQCCIV